MRAKAKQPREGTATRYDLCLSRHKVAGDKYCSVAVSAPPSIVHRNAYAQHCICGTIKPTNQHPCAFSRSRASTNKLHNKESTRRTLTTSNRDIAEEGRGKARPRLLPTRQTQRFTGRAVFPSGTVGLWAVRRRAPPTTYAPSNCQN